MLKGSVYIALQTLCVWRKEKKMMRINNVNHYTEIETKRERRLRVDETLLYFQRDNTLRNDDVTVCIDTFLASFLTSEKSQRRENK